MCWNYIIVGGGLSGSVLAHRLLSKNASLRIMVVEAGPNADKDPNIIYPNRFNLTEGIGGTYDWRYKTVPQVHLNGREIDLSSGKALGGGTAINLALWTRGDRFDFNLWAETVGDPRWGYQGLLPYMKITEAFDGGSPNPLQHGSKGPAHIESVRTTRREYPLRKMLLQSWQDMGIAVLPNLDANCGNPLGIGDVHQNRKHGRRELASAIYSLDGITIMTDTTVAKILIQRNIAESKHNGGRNNMNRNNRLVATGVVLTDGSEIQGREVILCSGSIRTPQLLMLSGVGPEEELDKHGISTIVNIPEVGKNLIDHALFSSAWKVKDLSQGYTVESGNPLFDNEQYAWGIRADFIVSTTVQNKKGLAKAIEADEGCPPDPNSHPLLRHDRTFNEHIMVYSGSPDGSTVALFLVHLLPTSRGTITLASANITDTPLINPNYYATHVDRFVILEGLRQ